MNITRSLSVAAFAISICLAQGHTKHITLKDADGNVYKTVRIGNQVWMAENLRATKFNDGSEIPLVTDNATWANLLTPGYCWYNNDAAYKKTYGALYNWYTVHSGKLAPAGWHVPSDAEWDTLKNYLIANGYNWDGTRDSNKIAKSLAAQKGWNAIPSGKGSICEDLGRNNKSGFSALPSGLRLPRGVFNGGGDLCAWWSSTGTNELFAYYRLLHNKYNYLRPTNYYKSSGFSVRLVRDK